MEGFERVQSHSSSGNRRMQVRVALGKKILLSDDIAEEIGPDVDLFVNRAEDFIQIAIVRGQEFRINQNLVRHQRGYVNCAGFLKTLSQYTIPDQWTDVESVEGGVVVTYDQRQPKTEVQVDVERA